MKRSVIKRLIVLVIIITPLLVLIGLLPWGPRTGPRFRFFDGRSLTRHTENKYSIENFFSFEDDFKSVVLSAKSELAARGFIEMRYPPPHDSNNIVIYCRGSDMTQVWIFNRSNYAIPLPPENSEEWKRGVKMYREEDGWVTVWIKEDRKQKRLFHRLLRIKEKLSP